MIDCQNMLLQMDDSESFCVCGDHKSANLMMNLHHSIVVSTICGDYWVCKCQWVRSYNFITCIAIFFALNYAI